MWVTKVCAQPACGAVAEQGKTFCKAHAEQNYRTEAPTQPRTHDDVDEMYQRRPWPKFRLIVLRQNPLCQRILKGQRCHNLSCVVHHLQSPRIRRDLFVTPQNVVALCECCHPGGTEGTPQWKVGVDYVKTEFKLLTFGPAAAQESTPPQNSTS
jgi:hypothetical protein